VSVALGEDTRDLIARWMIAARQQRDPFVRFFITYMCLDAYMTAGSGCDLDKAKLKWLTETTNPLRDNWTGTPRKTVPLRGLVKVGRVEDMRPNHRGKYKYLNEPDDLHQVVNFIYQVRCNLFHGGKSAVNSHDRDLARWSADILERWLEWTLVRTRESE
jgi:hypothetical protein